MQPFLRTSSSYCPPLSFTPAHSWWVIHHRRRPLSFLWLGWLVGLTGWLAGLLGFWLSGPWTRVPPRLFRSFSLPLPLLYYSLFFLFLLPLLLFLLSAASQTSMYSFYSYTGVVPTCSSGSAGRSFALFAYRNCRISPGTSCSLREDRRFRQYLKNLTTFNLLDLHLHPRSRIFLRCSNDRVTSPPYTTPLFASICTS